MNDLTSKQRAFLRSLAQRLKPVVHIGSGGVTDAVVRSVEDALRTRELLKARVLEGAPETVRATADQLARRLPGVHVPVTTGRTIVVYRAFAENPEIELPRASAR